MRCSLSVLSSNGRLSRENLASLEKAMGVLKAKRDDVQRMVNREEFSRHRRRLAQVQLWLTSILTIENQYNYLLSISKLELQRLCLWFLFQRSEIELWLWEKGYRDIEGG